MRPIQPEVASRSPAKRLRVLAVAARDSGAISGWTHNFYKYPARFSPNFARTAIEEFSGPGDLIADPYMGGGTSIIEGMAAGRHVIGNDLNALAAFVTRVKATPLSFRESDEIVRWAHEEVPGFGYRDPCPHLEGGDDGGNVRNLSLVRARFIKKVIGLAIASILNLPTRATREFARCAVLSAGQWALDGRRRHTSLTEFRERLASTALDMIPAMQALAEHCEVVGGRADILNLDATFLPAAPELMGRKVSLVVTSPPYPGVHVLYHRWQVDGRRESPAPYWISASKDGHAAAFYNFGSRLQQSSDEYFRTSLRTLLAIRKVMRRGGHMVQLVAFNKPDAQLPRYLGNLAMAGFKDIARGDRVWREVPHRKWHAALSGKTDSARELVLVHRAE